MIAPTEPIRTPIASFRQQASIFSILNLFVIAALPLLHVLMVPYVGPLSITLFVALGAGFLFHVTVFMWIQTRTEDISRNTIAYLTICSIGVNSALTFVAATTSRHDSQYFALMIIPILEAAFRFSFLPAMCVVAVADLLNFYWVWVNYRVHPSPEFNEYIEAGTVSTIYTLVGIIVWLLVNRLKEKEIHLAHNIEELQKTRRRLLEEEKLAAIGRLSSAIAHEIRNPVAMISSSLAMAYEPGVAEPSRIEMFDIASKEARRLEKLTQDFLEYARPQALEKRQTVASDSLLYVASACKGYASAKSVRINVDVASDLKVTIDPSRVQQALINLVKNAIEASPLSEAVTLRATVSDHDSVWLDVLNGGPAIPTGALERIFEPFFTTKKGGTGLGLAIARNIARAHGGDLFLRVNEPGRVCFTLELPIAVQKPEAPRERTWAES